MSWAEEDWTVGLSGRVLQKVKELQVQHDRLSRETKQKQLQLDTIQTNLEKQTLKVKSATLVISGQVWETILPFNLCCSLQNVSLWQMSIKKVAYMAYFSYFSYQSLYCCQAK